MRLLIFAALAPTFCSDIPPLPPEVPRYAETVITAMNQTVMLGSIMRQGEKVSLITSYCGGVMVGPSYILTADHCVDDKITAWYVTRADWLTQPPLEALVVHRNPGDDLALLKTTETFPMYAEIGWAPRFGSFVFTVNHGGEDYWQINSGLVIPGNIEQTFGLSSLFTASIAVRGGASGGGLFDVNGNLVGVVSEKIKNKVKSHYAPAYMAREWIRQ